MILNGKELALKIESKIKEELSKYETKPVLATIIVGKKPESVTYVNMKLKACERVGIIGKKIELDDYISENDLIKEIKKLNNDSTVSGILIQHPLPSHLDEQKIFNYIDPKKDVDGLNAASFGNMVMGSGGFYSATPAAIMAIIKYYGILVEEKSAVVIGRSNILGKPIAMLLLNANATVTICHSKTKDLDNILKDADIIVVALGKPKFIKAKLLKKDSVIIDAGYNEGNVGDVDFEGVDESISYTPVPGGVGPVTIAKLLEQTVDAFERKER